MAGINKNVLAGTLVGAAVGDALGLARENLSRRRQSRLFGPVISYNFIFGRGMVSDDTEHACMTAAALLESRGEPERFGRALARRLRWWFAALPAGIGLATLRSIIKLWLGFSPRKSGVFSAGNGPAMRSPVIGVFCGGDQRKMRELVSLSVRLTHTDPKAEYGAFAAAFAASMASQITSGFVVPYEYYKELASALGPGAGEFLDLIKKAAESAAAGETAADFAKKLGLEQGITGYMYHTVPIVIQVWLRHQSDYEGGVREVIECGGDTDTTAAVLGGIIGAGVGLEGIPERWRAGLFDWPWSVAYMTELAAALSDGGPVPKRHFFLVPLRNIAFMAIVLFHGFRRLLPPY
jgi:ADP-ribosylglycohydrolase